MTQIYLAAFGFLGIIVLFFQRKIRNKIEKAIKLKRKKEIASEKRIAKWKGSNFKKKHFEEITKKQQKDFRKINNLFKRIEILMLKKDFISTEKLLVSLLCIDPENIKANRILADIYMEIGKNRKAELLYKKIIAREENTAYFTNLGLSLYKQKKYRQALVSYKKAIQLDKKTPGRFINLGEVYFKLGIFSKAAQAFEEAYKRDIKNMNFLFLLAEALMHDKKYSEAKKILLKIINNQPYNKEAQNLIKKLELKGY